MADLNERVEEQYYEDGPFKPHLVQVDKSFTLDDDGDGDKDDEWCLSVRVTLPQRKGEGPEPQPNAPIVMLINGFLLREAWYEYYANHLASHGYVVVQYWPKLLSKTVFKTISGNTDKEVKTHPKLLSWLIYGDDSPAKGLVSCDSKLGVMGHSRGGKVAAYTYLLSTSKTIRRSLYRAGPGKLDGWSIKDTAGAHLLLAGANGNGNGVGNRRRSPTPDELEREEAEEASLPRVQGLVLLDPVDTTASMQPWFDNVPGINWVAEGATTTLQTKLRVSVINILYQRKAAGKPVKAVLIGAGITGKCNPDGANWRMFWDALDQGTSINITLDDGGHMQFMGARYLWRIAFNLLCGSSPKLSYQEAMKWAVGPATFWLDSQLKEKAVQEQRKLVPKVLANQGGKLAEAEEDVSPAPVAAAPPAAGHVPTDKARMLAWAERMKGRRGIRRAEAINESCRLPAGLLVPRPLMMPTKIMVGATSSVRNMVHPCARPGTCLLRM